LVSTLGVYGNPNYFPTDEMHPLQPVEAYSISKANAEKILMNYPNMNNRKRIIVRLFNTYGAGQKESMLVPTIINQIRSSKNLVVHNLDYTRDFIYISDIVKGIYFSGIKAKNGDVINLGTGIETSVGSLIDLVKTIVRKKIVVKVNKSNSSLPVIKRSQSDIKKANSVLSWYPEVSLKDGLKKLILNSKIQLV
jgi:nucleoside-diphosphate-sugar epimerase